MKILFLCLPLSFLFHVYIQAGTGNVFFFLFSKPLSISCSLHAVFSFCYWSRMLHGNGVQKYQSSTFHWVGNCMWGTQFSTIPAYPALSTTEGWKRFEQFNAVTDTVLPRGVCSLGTLGWWDPEMLYCRWEGSRFHLCSVNTLCLMQTL